jgi:hypothetical protein
VFSHGGQRYLHIKKERKKKRTIQAASSSKIFTSFFKHNSGAKIKLNIPPQKVRTHTAALNRACPCSDFVSKLFSHVFNEGIPCARTKSEAIPANVLVPFANEAMSKAGVHKILRTMDHLLSWFSLVDHPNIKRYILRIFNGMKVKFNEHL